MSFSSLKTIGFVSKCKIGEVVNDRENKRIGSSVVIDSHGTPLIDKGASKEIAANSSCKQASQTVAAVLRIRSLRHRFRHP